MNTTLTHSRIHPLFFALAVATFLVATLGFSSIASAQSINVKFDHLQVTQERGRVVVDYTIHHADWRQLQRHNISPSLDLYVDRQRGQRLAHVTGQTLRHRSGTLVFRSTDLDRSMVNVALSGRNRRAHINRVSYGRQRGDTVQLAVMRPVPPRAAPQRERRVAERPAPAPAPGRSISGGVTIRF